MNPRTTALLTVDEAAALVRVKPGTIRSWVQRGHLSYVVLDNGARLLCDADVLECESARHKYLAKLARRRSSAV